jgi:hypothetical protein
VDKIRNLDLRRLALEDSEESSEILIALDVPDPKVEFGPVVSREIARPGHPRFSGNRPLGFAPESVDQKQERARKTEEAAQFLTEVLGTVPHWLDAPRAFVATATGRQLREIVRSSLVRFVEPNRRIGARHA